MEITILLENNRIDTQFKSKHGLSVLIRHDGKNILLDTGPDEKFLKNARKMNIDLTHVDMLFLSHSHYDHTGGLNDFCKINNSTPVYLMDKIDNKYYAKRKLFFIPIGLSIKNKFRSRITKLDNDLHIDNGIYFIKNTVSVNQKPDSNKCLYKKESGGMIPDTFDHEGILVLEENNELAVFNSCSHNGLMNIIETVESKIPNKKIRSYVGGLHLSNPGMKAHENNDYLDMLIRRIIQKDINIYTGHCTGKYALEYMKTGLDDKLREINSGMKLGI